MKEIVNAILSNDAEAGDFAGLRIPQSYRGSVVRKEDVGMFEGLATADKDPRKSLHLQDVPTPEPGPGEALIAVM
ncbi:crotonyl-CoA carboxylase/reductase, partial [Streptomyces subrutilus]